MNSPYRRSRRVICLGKALGPNLRGLRLRIHRHCPWHLTIKHWHWKRQTVCAYVIGSIRIPSTSRRRRHVSLLRPTAGPGTGTISRRPAAAFATPVWGGGLIPSRRRIATSGPGERSPSRLPHREPLRVPRFLSPERPRRASFSCNWLVRTSFFASQYQNYTVSYYSQPIGLARGICG